MEGDYASDHLAWHSRSARCSAPPMRCDEHLSADQSARDRRSGRRALPVPETAAVIGRARGAGAISEEARSLGRRSGGAGSPQRRRAWWVAGAGWLCAVASALALVAAHAAETSRSRSWCGSTTARASSMWCRCYAGRATPEEAVTRYFLTHYSAYASASISRPPKATTRNAAPFTPRSATRPGTPCGPRPIRHRP